MKLKFLVSHNIYYKRGNSVKVMFDTNVFNHIRSREIDIATIPNEWEVHVTHIQKDEINQTPDTDQRSELNDTLNTWVNTTIPTESAVWGISKWDESKFGGENNSLNGIILNGLNSLKKKENNIQDALIAETAIKCNIVLVTNDRNLRTVAKANGATVIDLRK